LIAAGSVDLLAELLDCPEQLRVLRFLVSRQRAVVAFCGIEDQFRALKMLRLSRFPDVELRGRHSVLRFLKHDGELESTTGFLSDVAALDIHRGDSWSP
jgi:hypothetical protein